MDKWGLSRICCGNLFDLCQYDKEKEDFHCSRDIQVQPIMLRFMEELQFEYWLVGSEEFEGKPTTWPVNILSSM